MITAKPSKEQELDDLVEKAAGQEGLTFGVLQDILEQLRQSEGSLHHLLCKGIANDYQTNSTTGTALDFVTARFGELQPRYSYQRELQSLSKQHSQVYDSLQAIRQKAESFETAVQLQYLVCESDRHAGEGNYAKAASCIAQSKATSKPPEEQTAAEAQMQALLEDRSGQMARDLTARLRGFIDIGTVSNLECTVTVKSSTIGDAWAALVKLEVSDEALTWLAKELDTKVFGLLLSSRTAPQVSSRNVDGERTILIISWQTPDSELSKEAAIIDILDFIQDFVFEGQPGPYRLLGSRIWHRFAQDYIASCLTPCLPESSAEFLDFEVLAVTAREMERCLVDRGFLGPLDSSALTRLPVHVFTQQHMDSWLHKRRLQLVTEARPLLVQPDYDTVLTGLPLPLVPDANESVAISGMTPYGSVGSDASQEPIVNWGSEGEEGPLLATGRYQISRSCERLVALLQASLEEVCRLENGSIAHSIMLAFYDIASLCAALPPVVHHKELQVPLLAALYHNDCLHLARELLLMPHCFPMLQKQLHVSFSFQRAAEDLQKAGTTCLDELARAQSNELRELLEANGGFQQVHRVQHGIKARKVVQQALHTLGRSGRALRPVLAPASFIKFGVQVIGAFASKLTDDVLAIQDISVEESEDLPKILQPAAEECAATFVGNQQTVDDFSLIQLVNAISTSTLALGKLKAVLGILEAKLADIQTEWQNGVFQKQGLTAREIDHLIRALFEDTDLRRAVLKDVSSTY